MLLLGHNYTSNPENLARMVDRYRFYCGDWVKWQLGYPQANAYSALRHNSAGRRKSPSQLKNRVDQNVRKRQLFGETCAAADPLMDH